MLVNSESMGDFSSSPARDVNNGRLALDNGSMDASRRDNHHDVGSMGNSMNRVSEFDAAIVAAKVVTTGTLVLEGGVDRDGSEAMRVENLLHIDFMFKVYKVNIFRNGKRVIIKKLKLRSVAEVIGR